MAETSENQPGTEDEQPLTWQRIDLVPPPANERLWGYDRYYDGVGLCYWNGTYLNDDGHPKLERLQLDHDLIGGLKRDAWITHWQAVADDHLWPLPDDDDVPPTTDDEDETP